MKAFSTAFFIFLTTLGQNTPIANDQSPEKDLPEYYDRMIR